MFWSFNIHHFALLQCSNSQTQFLMKNIDINQVQQTSTKIIPLLHVNKQRIIHLFYNPSNYIFRIASLATLASARSLPFKVVFAIRASESAKARSPSRLAKYGNVTLSKSRGLLWQESNQLSRLIAPEICVGDDVSGRRVKFKLFNLPGKVLLGALEWPKVIR